MNPIVKKDILNVIEQTLSIIKSGNLFKLRELSDHVIHNAAVFQDKDSITIAVTIYSMSKIYKNVKDLDNMIVSHLSNAKEYLGKGNFNQYEKEIKNMVKDITEKDEKTKFYIMEVLERAQIKKASKMFEHGISLGQVADALGVSLWELMDYVGKTRIVDKFEQKTNVIDKLKFARGLFK